MTSPDTTHWRRLVLVAGHRRSGSSWLANALGRSEAVQLVPYEPLWLKWHPGSPYEDVIRAWRGRDRWLATRDSTSDRESEALLGHLRWLCEHYFDGPVDRLLIKEPHPNWLPTLTGALGPDQVVYLRRHPLGIVNSYDKANLYRKWHVDREWEMFRRELPSLLPDLAGQANLVRHPAEQVAFIAHACDRLADSLLQGVPHRIVRYEQLGSDPETHFSRLYRWLDLPWDEGSWARLQPLIRPAQTEAEHGFRFVRKRSRERVNAWRRELPAHLIRRVHRLMRRLGADEPFPGDGLPSLTPAELWQGARTYLARRRAYWRHFGARSVVESR